MNKKIFKGIFISSVLTMLACVLLIFGVIYNHFDDRLKGELKSKAQLVAVAMNSEGDSFLKNIQDDSVRVTHISAEGKVLFDTEADSNSLENHSDRAEFKDAILNGYGESTRHSGTLEEKTVYCAIRLKDGTVIRLSMTQNTVWYLLLGTLPTIILILIIVVFLSAVLSSEISKRIVKPINEINLDDPAEDEGYEELAPLLRKISTQNRKIKKEKRRLSKSREEFKLITENMSEGLIIIDQNTNILSYNSAALKILSGGDSIVLGEGVFSVNHSKEFCLAVDTALKGENAEEHLKLNGKVYRLMASPAVTLGKVTGAVIVILDVTEQEKREQLRKEFTSNVSHELKTPLTSIYGISDIISTGLVKPEDVASFSEDIKKEAGRLIRLVEDIIHLSRLDEGGYMGDPAPVDVFEIAKSVKESLKQTAERAKVTLELSGKQCFVLGYSTVLTEMLFNLCDNAIKYNKKGGKVLISVTEREDNTVEIKVTDTGIGIPAKDLDRVFERFYRVDKSHSKQIGGTGLGLSIVKRAVLYHKGKVELTSKEGSGTTVTVILTAAK